jgi:hypothetical protein
MVSKGQQPSVKSLLDFTTAAWEGASHASSNTSNAHETKEHQAMT